jgi:hypothetical protein
MRRVIRASSVTPRKKDWREATYGTPRSDLEQEQCSKCAAYEVPFYMYAYSNVHMVRHISTHG